MVLVSSQYVAEEISLKGDIGGSVSEHHPASSLTSREIYNFKNMNNEIWKPIFWFELYEVSNLWNIRSIKRWIIKKNRLDKDWYIHVRLTKSWIKKQYILHRLIAQTFIQNPENKRTVNHKNGIKTDNQTNNLEWATDLENTRHYYKYLKK